MTLSWTDGILIAVGLVLLLVMIRWHADKKNPYDLRDLLVDHATGKAGIDKHVTLWFSGLSSWVVVSRQLAGKEVETLLLGVLGIFILQRAASKALDTYASTRPEGGDPPREIERK